jgi:hypothetical protein
MKKTLSFYSCTSSGLTRRKIRNGHSMLLRLLTEEKAKEKK